MQTFLDISFNRTLDFVSELRESGEFVWKSSSVSPLELFSPRGWVVETYRLVSITSPSNSRNEFPLRRLHESRQWGLLLTSPYFLYLFFFNFYFLIFSFFLFCFFFFFWFFSRWWLMLKKSWILWCQLIANQENCWKPLFTNISKIIFGL